jgi:hypothetical protein
MNVNMGGFRGGMEGFPKGFGIIKEIEGESVVPILLPCSSSIFDTTTGLTIS